MSALAQLLVACSLSSLLKVLFLPSYRSTDFEVHRNWLAITHSLPYDQWYFANTSEWTLDYPPMFAWFEKGLSKAAVYADEEMLNETNIGYSSEKTVLFQKFSVIFSDFLLYYATYRCGQNLDTIRSSSKAIQGRLLLLLLIVFNAGLLIVDHVHFQYNGFLFGILFLSLNNVLEENILWGAFWFALLLNFKHIFLYMAPAYGVFMLRTHCMDAKLRGIACYLSFSVARCLGLAVVVISVFLVSFGPFMGQIGQVLSRLFPFKRGLTHAYWAPNFWALYNVADKLLSVVGKKLKVLPANDGVKASFTGGLVGEAEHIVLPSITPLATVVLTLIAILPCLVDMWVTPRSLSYKLLGNQFLRALVFVSLSSFMFGWHVHEKAILMVILPATILAVRGTRKDTEVFLFLQAVGHYSLFPLLFMPFETVIKICLVLLYGLFAFSSFQRFRQSHIKEESGWKLPLLGGFETCYIFGLVFCELYCGLIHRFLPVMKDYEFLPLMITSVYCACGVTWCWLKLGYTILADRTGYPLEWLGKDKPSSVVGKKKPQRSRARATKTEKIQ